MLKRLHQELDDIEREKRDLIDEIQEMNHYRFYEDMSEYAKHVPDFALMRYYNYFDRELQARVEYVSNYEVDQAVEQQLLSALDLYNEHAAYSRFTQLYPEFRTQSFTEFKAIVTFLKKLGGRDFVYNEYRSIQVFPLVRVLPKELVRMVKEYTL